jgi:hypothetical protein
MRQQLPAQGLQGSKKANTSAAVTLAAMSRLNKLLLSQKLDTQGCQPQDFGTGWGKHTLCAKQAPAQPCHFYSFGETNQQAATSTLHHADTHTVLCKALKHHMFVPHPEC